MTPDRTSLADDCTSDAGFRPIAALAFWCSLFLAAGLFAVLALAPKLRTYHDLSQEYDSLQRQLVSTERRTESLAKVADALQHDPQFATELARTNFDAPSDEAQIPVGPQLSLAAWDEGPAVPEPANRQPCDVLADEQLLKTLADDRSVRVPLMAASSLLVLVAFALCGQRPASHSEGNLHSSRSGIRGWLADRYRKPAAD